MLTCPQCEQGVIYKAIITKTGELIFVCQECEAAWFKRDEIGVKPFIQYGIYMESLGYTESWKELEIISENIK